MPQLARHWTPRTRSSKDGKRTTVTVSNWLTADLADLRRLFFPRRNNHGYSLRRFIPVVHLNPYPRAVVLFSGRQPCSPGWRHRLLAIEPSFDAGLGTESIKAHQILGPRCTLASRAKRQRLALEPLRDTSQLESSGKPNCSVERGDSVPQSTRVTASGSL